jgi:hypothetical protein
MGTSQPHVSKVDVGGLTQFILHQGVVFQIQPANLFVQKCQCDAELAFPFAKLNCVF